MKGYIHSTETFGTVDGPGIRYVLFMQGCPMRCLYCHNPDTWAPRIGRQAEPEEIIAEYNKNKSFYRHGGITVTGGEPLLQLDFLTELFRLCKEQGIHTCIDTSGITFSPNNSEYLARLDTLLRYTDLVMLDIKHIDPEKHKRLTSMDNAPVLAFARYLDEHGVTMYIRHVVVEGYTDESDDLIRLGEFIGTLKNIRALDVLPYHAMGEPKYRELGIDYPLYGMPPLGREQASIAKQHILDGIKRSRKMNKS